MLTAVHSDNVSEYRPLLKQLLLAQPEHRVLERLGRSSPAIAQLAHRFLAPSKNMRLRAIRTGSTVMRVVRPVRRPTASAA